MASREWPLKWPEGWPRLRGRKGDLPGDRHGSVDIDAAFRRLASEVAMIPARNIVISSNVGGNSRRGEVTAREDGGVAVYFTIDADQLTMAQDSYSTVSDNARSLAIAINGMRALKRHGGDMMMKRAFSGFTALPPPSSGPIIRQWWEVLGMRAPADLVGILTNAQILALAEDAYRQTARKAHPDAGGSQEAMAATNAAIEAARTELA